MILNKSHSFSFWFIAVQIQAARDHAPLWEGQPIRWRTTFIVLRNKITQNWAYIVFFFLNCKGKLRNSKLKYVAPPVVPQWTTGGDGVVMWHHDMSQREGWQTSRVIWQSHDVTIHTSHINIPRCHLAVTSLSQLTFPLTESCQLYQVMSINYYSPKDLL